MLLNFHRESVCVCMFFVLFNWVHKISVVIAECIVERLHMFSTAIRPHFEKMSDFCHKESHYHLYVKIQPLF